MNAKEYYYDNVLMVVEMGDEDGYRWWSEALHDDDVKPYIEEQKSFGYYLSDIDMLANQPNTFVARVNKLAQKNWFENQSWVKSHNFKSMYEVIDYILENNLWRP